MPLFFFFLFVVVPLCNDRQLAADADDWCVGLLLALRRRTALADAIAREFLFL